MMGIFADKSPSTRRMSSSPGASRTPGEHWFGTNAPAWMSSRKRLRCPDLTRTGLVVGLLVTIIGAIVGMTAGYFRGRIDDVLSVFMNVMLIVQPFRFW
jgi:peptide/nickel transport system permease protein